MLALVGGCQLALAEETTTEKAETIGNKMADSVKKTYRNAKNEICEMVDGKAKCAARKAENEIKNAADKAETTAKELKNKVD